MIKVSRYIEAILHSREYAIIDDYTKSEIEAEQGYEAHCVIENNANTIGHSTLDLPVLAKGLWRMWNMQDWVNTGNKRKMVIARIEAAQEQSRQFKQAMREAVKQWYIGQGLNSDSAEQMIKMLGDDAIKITYDSLPKQ